MERSNGQHRHSRNSQPTFCTNCGGEGHLFRQCIAPVTSYGVIMVRAREGFNLVERLVSQPGLVTGVENESLEYLLIQRRDSLGFIELMRARYKVTDVEYIILHLKGITEHERQKYRDGPFEEVWNSMWGLNHSHLYKNEYETARQKWETIHRGITDASGKFWSVQDMIDAAGPAQATPEWGFPKGRRDAQESDFDCAMREMFEETGVKEEQVIPIQNLEPLVESFLGTNHVNYCHKYFIVWVPADLKVEFTMENDHMRREIGDIQWLRLDDAMSRIRPENIEKREVLLRAASLFRNLCPFPLS